MKKKIDNGDEQETLKNGKSHTPNASRTVAIIKSFILRTKTWLMRHISLMPGQVFHYFKYFLAWIFKLGFRTIFINLLIIGICCYIFWESGKDTFLIEPFEVPEQLAKKGYNGKVIANKLRDQMNYIQEKSQIVSTLTPVFSSKGEEQKEIIIPSLPQTEKVDIQIPVAGISLNFIIQYIKRLRGHEPILVIGEVTQHNHHNDTLLKVTVRVKGKPDKSFSGKIRNLNDRLRSASKHIYQYTKPIILVGYLIRDEKNDSQCIEMIRNIISQGSYDDQHYDAYSMWGYVLQRQRNYDEALEKYGYAVNRAEKDKQKLASANFSIGVVLASKKKDDEAIAKFKKITENNPKYTVAHVCWGELLARQEKYDEAIEKYKEAIKINPEYTVAYVRCGELLERQEKYDEAIEKYKKAIEMNPNYKVAYVSWGLLLERQEKYDEAIEKYQKAIGIDTKYTYTYAYVLWGNVLKKQGKYDEAIEKYKKAIDINPKCKFAYASWFLLLVKQEKYDEAIEKFQKIIEINPKNTSAYLIWGWLLAMQEKDDEAIEKFQKTIEINPKNRSAYISWGLLLERQEKHDEAIKVYQKVIEMNPKDTYVKNFYKKRIDELQKKLETK